MKYLFTLFLLSACSFSVFKMEAPESVIPSQPQEELVMNKVIFEIYSGGLVYYRGHLLKSDSEIRDGLKQALPEFKCGDK